MLSPARAGHPYNRDRQANHDPFFLRSGTTGSSVCHCRRHCHRPGRLPLRPPHRPNSSSGEPIRSCTKTTRVEPAPNPTKADPAKRHQAKSDKLPQGYRSHPERLTAPNAQHATRPRPIRSAGLCRSSQGFETTVLTGDFGLCLGLQPQPGEPTHVTCRNNAADRKERHAHQKRHQRPEKESHADSKARNDAIAIARVGSESKNPENWHGIPRISSAQIRRAGLKKFQISASNCSRSLAEGCVLRMAAAHASHAAHTSRTSQTPGNPQVFQRKILKP
ncbi:hypothetical protein KKY_3116 [Pelagibacterium halotolerans B2]|uniref:Uncharacterized protein n=1 Tax=Pelagibacterium halotolerans (strain DSM 22347 / JCM 15775 / CGMCC 1.7692 / B2) TaxID=1082931 RepID=G4RGV3_PELHB|nr:hypothetical protein KKY_3116 [Pelagibacterium halotolerans B2]